MTPSDLRHPADTTTIGVWIDIPDVWIGAGDGNRTHHINLGKVAVYHWPTPAYLHAAYFAYK